MPCGGIGRSARSGVAAASTLGPIARVQRRPKAAASAATGTWRAVVRARLRSALVVGLGIRAAVSAGLRARSGRAASVRVFGACAWRGGCTGAGTGFGFRRGRSWRGRRLPSPRSVWRRSVRHGRGDAGRGSGLRSRNAARPRLRARAASRPRVTEESATGMRSLMSRVHGRLTCALVPGSCHASTAGTRADLRQSPRCVP